MLGFRQKIDFDLYFAVKWRLFCEKPTLRFVLVNVLFHQERQGAPGSWRPPPPSLFLVARQESNVNPRASLANLTGLGHFVHSGGWEQNGVAQTLGEERRRGQNHRKGSQTPDDPKGVGGLEYLHEE